MCELTLDPGMTSVFTTPAGDPRWYLPGETVSIAGRNLTCGFMYVGTAGPEASVIVSDLSVAPVGQQPVERLNDCESYSHLPSGHRGAYLDWLARGRVGRVFPQALSLFLMGAERRWLMDRVSDREELLALSEECRRLAEEYLSVEVFSSRAADLADAIRLWTEATPPSQVPVDFRRTSNLRTRIGLGEIAADRRPIPADWAILLAADHPHGAFIRRVMRHEEFRELFAVRYSEQFGGGLLFPADRPTTFELYLENRSFPGRLLPLLFRAQARVEHASPQAVAAMEVAKRVESELKAYLGHKRSSAPVNAALLPEELVERFGQVETDHLIHRIEEALAKEPFALISWADILNCWGAPEFQYGIPHRLARVLARHGFGFEPHPTYSPQSWFSLRSALIFFRDADRDTAGRRVQAASAIADAVAPVVRDASLPLGVLADHIKTLAELSGSESVRLRGRVYWHGGFRTRPTYERISSYADLPLVDWLSNLWLKPLFDGRSLVDLVKDETYLEQRSALGRLGIDLPPRLFRKPAPPTVVPPVPQRRSPNPAPAPNPVAPTFQLDEAAVVETLQDSRRATAFVESLGSDTVEPISPSAASPPRLSESERAVLQALVTEQPKRRHDLDAFCRTRNLFTFAFVERINALAIERTGEPAVYIDGEVDLDLSTLSMIIEKEPSA